MKFFRAFPSSSGPSLCLATIFDIFSIVSNEFLFRSSMLYSPKQYLQHLKRSQDTSSGVEMKLANENELIEWKNKENRTRAVIGLGFLDT
jgi:hypothetical protein